MAGLKLKAKKCQLFQEEIPFLGHIVSAAGVRADPAKCQQVKDWPVSRDLHEVQSFVGLCLYYRRHIRGFTELAARLYELATKGMDFEWKKQRDKAFNELKAASTSYWDSPWKMGCGISKPTQVTSGWEQCCPKCRTGRSASSRMPASRWRGHSDHGSMDPVGQPPRWIDVIDTYDVTFQHHTSIGPAGSLVMPTRSPATPVANVGASSTEPLPKGLR